MGIFRLGKKTLEEKLKAEDKIKVDGKEYEVVYSYETDDHSYYILKNSYNYFLRAGEKQVPLEKEPLVLYMDDGIVAAVEKYETENNTVKKTYEIYIAIDEKIIKKEVRTHFDLKDIGTYVKGMLLSLIFANYDRSDGMVWYYDLKKDEESISPFSTSPYKNNA